MTEQDWERDRAVLRVKGLAKNTNVRNYHTTYRCTYCRNYRTRNLAEAWIHSHVHGPWEANGSLAYQEMYGPFPHKEGRNGITPFRPH